MEKAKQAFEGMEPYEVGYKKGYEDGRKDLITATWQTVSGYVTPGGDPVWVCSNCGKGQHVWGVEAASYGAHTSEHQWVACPNCGAIMK